MDAPIGSLSHYYVCGCVCVYRRDNKVVCYQGFQNHRHLGLTIGEKLEPPNLSQEERVQSERLPHARWIFFNRLARIHVIRSICI